MSESSQMIYTYNVLIKSIIIILIILIIALFIDQSRVRSPDFNKLWVSSVKGLILPDLELSYSNLNNSKPHCSCVRQPDKYLN